MRRQARMPQSQAKPTMNRSLKTLLAAGMSVAVLCFAARVLAQNAAVTNSQAPASSALAAPPPSAPVQRSAAELEKLAMPMALYPDPLISIMLPASVYPLEIVQAARFVKDTNNIAKLDDQPWDENVKDVARVPELIQKMSDDLTWTIELGQAFLDQPKELMDTIQALRLKAQKAGTLQTTPQQVVVVTNMIVTQTNVSQVVYVTNQIVQIQPVNPQVIYVPTYPPTVYYPPPAYVYNPYAPLVTFGVGIAVVVVVFAVVVVVAQDHARGTVACVYEIHVRDLGELGVAGRLDLRRSSRRSRRVPRHEAAQNWQAIRQASVLPG